MYIKVHVIPKSRKESIKKISDSIFEITVKEPAERNLANKRIKELLASEYKIQVGCVRLVTGHHSSTKIFDIVNID